MIGSPTARLVATGAVLSLAACSGGTASGAAASPPSGAGSSTNGSSVSPEVALSLEELTPTGMAVDAEGRLYVSDCLDGYIVRFDPSGEMTIVAGLGIANFTGALSGDGGPATEAAIDCPYGLAFGEDGNLYFADHANNRIRIIDGNGVIATVAGKGPLGTGQEGRLLGDGGPAAEARLQEPVGLAFDDAGGLVFADRDNYAVRRIDPDGSIETIAGIGRLGFSGDGGPATEAELDQPEGVAIDQHGNVLIADSANNRIRKIDPRGVITTIGGTGIEARSGDGGPATEADMQPDDLAFDRRGNLFVAEYDNHVVRVIGRDGIITTAAGTGEAGCSGSGGAATEATLTAPIGLAFDARGDLYIADEACGIMVVHMDGMIEAFPS